MFEAGNKFQHKRFNLDVYAVSFTMNVFLSHRSQKKMANSSVLSRVPGYGLQVRMGTQREQLWDCGVCQLGSPLDIELFQLDIIWEEGSLGSKDRGSWETGLFLITEL